MKISINKPILDSRDDSTVQIEGNKLNTTKIKADEETIIESHFINEEDIDETHQKE